MINLIKRNIFPTIIALSALSVSASAAFYSVFGLSKLFAGAQTEVIIMAGSLEVAKLVIASLLYQYWDGINKFLRTYLTIAAIILVLITSMGIYGFLSAAYQETYQKITVNENETAYLQEKASFYEDDIARYDVELKQILGNISVLSNARVSSIQVRDTASATGIRNTISTAELRLSQERIKVEEDNRQAVQGRRQIASDSLQKYKLQILELQNSSATVGELGPLQYLSGLTDTPMDRIINVLLLIIIFVFDPLAISLVVAANYAFDIANRRNLYNEFVNDKEDPWYNDDDDDDPDDTPDDDKPTLADQIDRDFSLEDWDEESTEKRMEVVGQNGNEGEHYESDWEVVHDNIPKEKSVARILQKGPSKNRVQFEDGSEGFVKKNDLTIRYL